MAGAAGGELVEAFQPGTATKTDIRVRSPLIVVATLAFATVMALAALGGIYDPALGFEGGSPLVGWTCVAIASGLGLRAITLGVSVRGDRLRIRNLWRTRDVSVADVDRVDTDFYEGWMLGFVTLSWLRVVRFRVGNRWIRAWGLTGRPRTAARLAGRLEAACGLTPTRGPGAGR